METAMNLGMNVSCGHVNMSNPSRKPTRAALLLAIVALACVAPRTVRADETVQLEGTFSVWYMYPSTVNYCSPSGGDLSIEAQGLGTFPGLGAMFLTVKKCFTFSDGTYAGVFHLTAGNGDVIDGTYAGTQGPGDENGYGPFQGVLTITGGTGRFRHASGALTFKAVSGPDSVSVVSPTANGMAFYLIDGRMRSQEKH
jgi:hypothetical protein